MPPGTGPLPAADEAALLLALLPPPPGVVPLSTGRRPLGNTPERVTLAWLRRAAEAFVAALLALLLLFHIGFSVPDGAESATPSTAPAESTAPALSPSQAWSLAWADFVAPPVAAQGFGYVAIPVPTMVASLHSTFANVVDVETIDAAARAADLNPLLLFACIGAEQPGELRAAYPSTWRAYAGNPFDIAVYGAWHPTGYTLAESAAIAARTLATRLSVAPPGDEPALAWIDDPHNPAGQGVYATDPHWWSNVASISETLVQRAAADAGGTLAAPTLQALATYALAAATTPDAVAQALALALKAEGTGPLAWAERQVADLHRYVYQHAYTLAAGALAAAVTALGVSMGLAVVDALAGAVASALADVAAAGVAVGVGAAA